MQVGTIKIGVKQIGQPSPVRFRFWVNMCIIVFFPFITGFMMILPEKALDPLISGFIVKLIVLLTGGLKGAEKLMGDTTSGDYKITDIGSKPEENSTIAGTN